MDRNKRRVMIVVVVIFVVVLSFFAGRYSKGTVYSTTTSTEGSNSGVTGSDNRTGVPPDSLHH